MNDLAHQQSQTWSSGRLTIISLVPADRSHKEEHRITHSIRLDGNRGKKNIRQNLKVDEDGRSWFSS